VTRILLVEDHATFREALGTFLDEAPDFEVAAQVGSLAEANGIASAEVDVAIIDLYLPDGDGIDLVRQLREEAPHLKTLVLTGSLDPEAEVLAKEAGADKVLFKSAGIVQIAEAIRRIV
jgi:two-component system, NarL family, nitrate/nitrite response regulator NarL